MAKETIHAHNLVVGLDLGATSIKAGLVDHAGECLPLDGCPTEAHAGGDHVLAKLGDLVDAALAHARNLGRPVVGIGVGTPGGVRQPEGTVVAGADNFAGWNGMVVGTPLSARAGGVPAVVDNDANAATLGEWMFGNGFGDADIAVGLTLGTGIGGGILIDGHLLRGRAGLAGELGHLGIVMHGRVCTCGGAGCLEAYTGIVGIEALAAEAHAGGCAAPWTTLRGGALPPAVLEAARAEDRHARVLWERYGEYLGYGVSSIIAALRPEAFVLFGGVRHAAEFFLPALEDTLRQRDHRGPAPPIRLTTLGDSAGVQGAAALVWAELQRAV